MKKLIFKILFLTLIVFAPVSTMAEISVHINIPLPPPIIFPAPPEVVVIPETDVYAVPDVQEDIFFYGGWWWRPWQGRWYRSHYYDRGWAYYHNAPNFRRQIPPGWRNDYRAHKWRGYEWQHQRVPQRDLQRNWRGWGKNKHWEKQNSWGVKGLSPKYQKQKKYYRNKPQQKSDNQTGHQYKGKGPGKNGKEPAGKKDRR
ncbi:MAG: hypothetical protein WC373_03090 [Smithella sp.]|jgi:hypothetical protein